MKAKKVLSIILACGMTMSLLAGCGQQESNETSSQKESISTTVESASGVVEDEPGEKGVTFPLEEPITLTAYVY